MFYRCQQVVATLLLTTIFVAAGLLAPAWSFGAEDPLDPRTFHHNIITKEAALAAGFGEDAAKALAWHADYIDSYAYNPVFWLNPADGGSPNRAKAALANHSALTKLHFDDLTSGEQVELMWNRYLTGTMAGLIWAWKHEDESAALHIIGISLHAIQDFYSHSNWLDNPRRRARTWFTASPSLQRLGALYTGSYEQPDHLGIKPHGKIMPACTMLAAPAVRTAFQPLCLAISPLSNQQICEYWRQCKNSSYVRPEIYGVRVPRYAAYIGRPGIALDSTWQSAIAARVRDVPDLRDNPNPGAVLFNAALSRATEASQQWLGILENQMSNLGAQRFWDSLKTSSSSMRNRTAQFEQYHRFGFHFLATGPYPYRSTGRTSVVGAAACHEILFARPPANVPRQ